MTSGIPWTSRMHHNPTIPGSYQVLLSNGTEGHMSYGTSKGWDNGRDRIRRKSGLPVVTHWRVCDRTPCIECGRHDDLCTGPTDP